MRRDRRPHRQPSQAALAMRHPMGRAVAKARIASKLRELLIHVHILAEGEECSLLLADAAWVLGIGTEVALAVHGPGSTDTRRLHGTLRGLVQLALEGYRWKPYLTAQLDEALQLSSRLLVEHEGLAFDVMPGAEFLAHRLRTRCIDGSEVAGAEIYARAGTYPHNRQPATT